MPWLQKGATKYHAQLGLLDNGRAINLAFVRVSFFTAFLRFCLVFYFIRSTIVKDEYIFCLFSVVVLCTIVSLLNYKLRNNSLIECPLFPGQILLLPLLIIGKSMHLFHSNKVQVGYYHGDTGTIP